MIFLLEDTCWLVTSYLRPDIQHVSITTRRTYYHWLRLESTVAEISTDSAVVCRTVVRDLISRLWIYSVHIAVQLYL